MTLPIPEQIQNLNQQLEEAIQRVYMIRGAIQVLELNLPEEEETTTEEPTTEE